MTIDEAIEILERTVTREPAYGNPIIVEATKLSVEALKQILWQRKEIFADKIRLLPGETNET